MNQYLELKPELQEELQLHKQQSVIKNEYIYNVDMGGFSKSINRIYTEIPDSHIKKIYVLGGNVADGREILDSLEGEYYEKFL